MSRSVGLTPESRENRLVSLAMDEAERQITAGTASPLIVAHFLRIGCQKAQLEQEKLRNETALIAAKKSAIEAEEKEEQRYQEAIEAIQRYSRSSEYYD